MENRHVLLILWDYPFDCRKAPVLRVYHLFRELRRNIPHTYLIFGDGDTSQKNNENIVILECKRDADPSIIKQAFYSLKACLQTLHFIRLYDIDTVIMRGVGTALLMPFLQISNIRVFYDFHGFLYKELEVKKRSKIAIMGVRQVERYLLKRTDGIIGITDEITQYAMNRSSNSEKPCITIGNGFNVTSVLARKPVSFTGDELHLLCVANVNYWHGLDRLLEGLSSYSGSSGVVLHIVGDGYGLPYIRQMTENIGITDKVIFHGFMSGRELDDLFNQCHIAIGSLGIHRIGLNVASTLKVREYCARGIPFVYGVSDPDFPTAFPYVLQVPADESPIDIERVLIFARTVCGDQDHSQKMRSYAEEHIDWSVKTKGMGNFLELVTKDTAI